MALKDLCWNRRGAILLGALAFVLSVGKAQSVTGNTPTVTIFAASSTTEAVEDAAESCTQTTGIKARAVFAASSTLARQIAKGAPADIFLSANTRWMDTLGSGHFIDQSTRHNLLGNSLVLIAGEDDALPSLKLGPDTNLKGALQGTRLAMGDPSHVPAGIYARSALVNVGLWPQVAEHIAPAANVRAALALVARGEARLGAVYASDAMVSDAVKVVARFPADSHPPILYPVALVAGRQTKVVQAFFSCFTSSESIKRFQMHGFIPPDRGGE